MANAIHEANARTVAQQVEAQPTPSRNAKEPRFGPRPTKFPRTGPLKKGAGWAHEQGWFDMGLDEGSSESDDSTEKHHQEECRRAAAERTKRLKLGLAMTGKEYWLAGAKARARPIGEVEPSDRDQSPWEIFIHFTVTGYSESSC